MEKRSNFRNKSVPRSHMYMLVEISPKIRAQGFVVFMKMKSGLMIYQRLEILNQYIEISSFGVNYTMAIRQGKIEEYIKNQLKENEEMTQLSIDFNESPYTDGK